MSGRRDQHGQGVDDPGAGRGQLFDNQRRWQEEWVWFWGFISGNLVVGIQIVEGFQQITIRKSEQWWCRERSRRKLHTGVVIILVRGLLFFFE